MIYSCFMFDLLASTTYYYIIEYDVRGDVTSTPLRTEWYHFQTSASNEMLHRVKVCVSWNFLLLAFVPYI